MKLKKNNSLSLDKFINLVVNTIKKDNVMINNLEYNLNRSKLLIKFDFLCNIKNNLEIFLDDKKIISKNNSYFNVDVYDPYASKNTVKENFKIDLKDFNNLKFEKYNCIIILVIFYFWGLCGSSEVFDR